MLNICRRNFGDWQSLYFWVGLSRRSASGNIEIVSDQQLGDELIHNATDAIRAGPQVKTGAAHSCTSGGMSLIEG